MPEAAAETQTDAPASVAAVPETGRRPARQTAKVPANLSMDLALPSMERQAERPDDTTPTAAHTPTRRLAAAAVRSAQGAGAGAENRPLPAMADVSTPAMAAGIAPSPRTTSSRAVSSPASTGRTTAPTLPDPRRRDVAARRDPPAPTPEVHIHIGRIELSAVNPPPAGKREARPPAKPMTLDEYLGRRGGGGR